MAMRKQVGKQYGTVVLAVLVILSIGATSAIAGAPASRLFQSPVPDPPSNDNFVDAIHITATPFQDYINNYSASIEVSEPQPCEIGRSAWYVLTPAEGTSYRVDMNGSSSDAGPIVAVYRANGPSLSDLQHLACTNWNTPLTFSTEGGSIYYLQVGNIDFAMGGPLTLNVYTVTPPANDNFNDATAIESLPYSDVQNTEGATVEAGEPVPSCTWNTPTRTIWYRYTPEADGSVMTQSSASYNMVTAVYTGGDLGSLTALTSYCYSGRVTTAVQQGVTYYFQVGNTYGSEFGDVNFVLDATPPPTADFYWYPWDPSKYDTVQFCDQSYDPAYLGFSAFWWDFGDGVTGSEYCANHQYTADGDYAVWHKVQTTDGREAEVTKPVQVRTHDVAITKFSVPKSASAGQTRQIVVGLRNYAYPEAVRVELQKSTAGGWAWVGALRQEVPVRQGNRTTDFNFSYTFTSDDAAIGKVTFRAVASIENARDALPADNEAISSPCKVSGK